MEVLKNFSTINANLVFRKGKILKTMSDQRNVMASVTLEEDFPQEVGIYDLTEFMRVLNLVDEPDLDFKENCVIIGDTSGRSKVKYFYSAIQMLTSPTKDIIMPACEVQFILDVDTLSKIRQAAGALGHKTMAITGKDGVITLTVADFKNKTSNKFSIDIAGDFEEDTFKFIIDIDKLKLIPGDYVVELSKKLVSHFVHKNTSLEYWIAIEEDSTYG